MNQSNSSNNNGSKFLRYPLAVFLLMYFTQLEFYNLSVVSSKLITIIHDSPVQLYFYIFTKMVNYIFLFGFVALFVVYVYVVDANIIRNSIYLTFICWTIFLFSFLKLIVVEVRPFMFSYFYKIGNVRVFDCEPDFGMPSAHMFFSISLLYMYKIHFFCKNKDFEYTPENKRNEQKQNSFRSKFQFVRTVALQYKDETEIQQDTTSYILTFKKFNIFAWIYLIILAICRYIAGSHFILQTIFGLILGYYWSQIYFMYFASPLKRLYQDSILDPNSRKKSIRFYYFAQLFVYFILVNLCYIRYLTRYEKEYESIREVLQEKCTNFFMLSAKNLYDSQTLFIPMFYIFFLRNINLSKKIALSGQKNTLDYYNLSRKKKIIRFLHFCISLLLVFGMKIGLEYLIFIIWKKAKFNLVIMFTDLVFKILLAFVLSVWIPFFNYKNKILLREEYITIIDFEDIKYKQKDFEGRTTYLVEDEDEIKEEKNNKNKIQNNDDDLTEIGTDVEILNKKDNTKKQINQNQNRKDQQNINNKIGNNKEEFENLDNNSDESPDFEDVEEDDDKKNINN